VVPILVQIQWERDKADHLLLDSPWFIARQPRNSRMSVEPIVQCPLACSKCHPPATSDTPEFDAQTLRQKATKRES
jgi:hypothetical protein